MTYPVIRRHPQGWKAGVTERMEGRCETIYYDSLRTALVMWWIRVRRCRI